MRDILSLTDPMPLQLGRVVRPEPKPTAEQVREKAFRDFAAMSDKKKVGDPAKGDGLVGLKPQVVTAQVAVRDSTQPDSWQCNWVNGETLVYFRNQEPKKPQADSEGWIKWEGEGPAPVVAGQLVDLRLRDGMVVPRQKTEPANWLHKWGTSDIVAYRPIQEPKKPEADADGWVTWDASKTDARPVEAHVVCRYRFRSGTETDAHHAGGMYWGETHGNGTIVAYSVIG